jgi:hypothetical protein
VSDNIQPSKILTFSLGELTSEMEIKESKVINKILERYLKQKNNLVIAVSDSRKIATSEKIFEIAATHDPSWDRTISVLTHCDLLMQGKQANVLRAALNFVNEKNQDFGVGCFIIKSRSRGDELTGMNMAKSEQKEHLMFSQALWQFSGVQKERMGSLKLIDEIEFQYLELIRSELTKLDIEGLRVLTALLKEKEALGAPCRTPREQRALLRTILENYRFKINSCLAEDYYNGSSTGMIWGDLTTACDRFRDEMNTKGSKWAFKPSDGLPNEEWDQIVTSRRRIVPPPRRMMDFFSTSDLPLRSFDTGFGHHAVTEEVEVKPSNESREDSEKKSIKSNGTGDTAGTKGARQLKINSAAANDAMGPKVSNLETPRSSRLPPLKIATQQQETVSSPTLRSPSTIRSDFYPEPARYSVYRPDSVKSNGYRQEPSRVFPPTPPTPSTPMKNTFITGMSSPTTPQRFAFRLQSPGFHKQSQAQDMSAVLGTPTVKPQSISCFAMTSPRQPPSSYRFNNEYNHAQAGPMSPRLQPPTPGLAPTAEYYEKSRILRDRLGAAVPREIVQEDENIYEWISRRYHSTKGRGLPGMVDPRLVHALFMELTEPWEVIVLEYLDEIAHSLWCTISSSINAACPPAVVGNIAAKLKKRLKTMLDQFMLEVEKRCIKRVQDERKQIQVTASENLFVEMLEKARSMRIMASYRKFQGKSSGNAQTGENDSWSNSDKPLDLFTLQLALAEPIPAPYTIHDYLKAYYDIALTRFVDGVCVNIIEEDLILDALGSFSEAFLDGLEDSEVAQITAESVEARGERWRVESGIEHMMNVLEKSRMVREEREMIV